MPEQFDKRICAQKTLIITELVCIIIIIIAIGLTAEVMITKSGVQIAYILLAIVCFFVLILVCISLYIKSASSCSELYTISIASSSLQSITDAFFANMIEEDAYISFCKIGKFSLRLLIQYTPKFDNKDLAQKRKKINRIINSRYHITTPMSMYEALTKLRVNLYVCERSSDEVYKFLKRDISILLKRNEIVIPAAVILDQKKLIFPDCMYGLTLTELKRYEIAARFLSNSLAANG